MIKKNFRRQDQFLLFIIFIFFTGFYFTSCDDDTSRLGLGILPASDTLNVNSFDTLSIYVFTERSPGIETGQPKYSPFGYYNDPIFGSTKAEFATEFGFSASDTIKGDNLVADSAIMYIRILENGVYGDVSSLVQMDAYLINNEFPEDSLHYSNYDPANFTDIKKIGSNKLQLNQAQIKFYFDQSFANMLLTPALDENDTTYNSIVAFKEKFKGLLFRTQPLEGNGAIALFNLYAFNSFDQGRQVPSFIQLFYHFTENDSIVNEQVTYTFERDEDLFFNMYEHDYSKSDFYSNLHTDIIDSVVYLQAMAGTQVRIHIPELDNWTEPGEIAVNSALLTVNLEDFDKTSDFLVPPFRLGMKVVHPDGEEELIEDLQTFSFDYFMGALSQDKYTFNITKHVQAVADGAENQDIIIYPVYIEEINNFSRLTENYILPERVVLAGTSNSTPVKLSIIYTKL